METRSPEPPAEKRETARRKSFAGGFSILVPSNICCLEAGTLTRQESSFSKSGEPRQDPVIVLLFFFFFYRRRRRRALRACVFVGVRIERRRQRRAAPRTQRPVIL
ncbi:uncharacterized protein K452DRAFT_117475 [Aplosporella prunicola CBS 121167]|uniref:Uncharacterized protein n=1 Tax=Aplosporella prunicola CBS 121167 TaxID=1176127 RepID=A0A6A6B0R9_9PEZI|nr:uncharacterized protein K452DRAFT_117475 [Aplosporella prunicola CBS 121167]KAF2136845.1 hypothetical protein K452DRAFT_117475 [Aplosporella prunicola CBS 121167]